MHVIRAEHRVLESPDLQLANFLLELIERALALPPPTCTTDVTSSALKQGTERGSHGSRHAVHPSLALIAQHVWEEGARKGENSLLDAYPDLTAGIFILDD